MRPRRLLPLLFCLSLPLACLGEDGIPAAEAPVASEAPPASEALPTASPESSADDAAERLAALQQRLDDSERQRADLSAQLNGAESAVVNRLRQENQRLKLQLREAQAQQPPRLLNDEQTWFATGGATALLAFILGALSRGSRRRQRREWIN